MNKFSFMFGLNADFTLHFILDSLNQFFIDYGAIGMFVAAYIAGSFIPFSSEAVMIALLATTDINPWLTYFAASIGNTLGSMTNYYIGTKGDMEKIGRWFHVNPKRLDKAKAWVDKYGAWTGLLTFVPLLGTVIALALGLMRCKFLPVLATTTVSKFGRYLIIVLAMMSL